MKKLYLTLLCATALTCGATIANAEETTTTPIPEKNIEQPVENNRGFRNRHMPMDKSIAEELKLTDEQKAKATEMRQNAREKMQSIMEKMKKLREEMDAIRSDNMKAFEEILTDEQKEIFAKIKAERKSRHEEMMKRHHFRPQPPMPME